MVGFLSFLAVICVIAFAASVVLLVVRSLKKQPRKPLVIIAVASLVAFLGLSVPISNLYVPVEKPAEEAAVEPKSEPVEDEQQESLETAEPDLVEDEQPEPSDAADSEPVESEQPESSGTTAPVSEPEVSPIAKTEESDDDPATEPVADVLSEEFENASSGYFRKVGKSAFDGSL